MLVDHKIGRFFFSEVGSYFVAQITVELNIFLP